MKEYTAVPVHQCNPFAIPIPNPPAISDRIAIPIYIITEKYMDIATRAFTPGSAVSGLDCSSFAEVLTKYEISIKPSDDVNVAIETIISNVLVEQLKAKNNAVAMIPNGVIR